MFLKVLSKHIFSDVLENYVIFVSANKYMEFF